MTDPDRQSSPSFPSANGHDDAALVGPVPEGGAVPRPRNEGDSPVPFQDLRIPAPTRAAPPLGARVAAFAGILVGGLLGGLIGYGTADLMSGGSTGWAVVGLLVGALAGAVGVGIVAGLTLRAMNEWKATVHPEDTRSAKRRRAANRPGTGGDDDDFKLRPHLRGTPRSGAEADPERD
ncbi:MAG: hypothetical protein R2761_01645 [Acidimicrobiales bacterium]